MNDTVAALATAPYRAALGVIRMSGPRAFEIAEQCLVFRGENCLIPPEKNRNLSFARITDGTEIIDEAVISAYRAPHSYTGEDVVEFSCHGGVYLLDRVLRLLFSHGARQALGGEFTKRAFLNGKTDLTRAEGVMDLIDSEYAAQARAAMSELDGSVGGELLKIRDRLLGCVAPLLAYVDYPDDEIGELPEGTLSRELGEARTAVRLLLNSYDTGKTVRDGLRTVLCGKPNAGKSSLMNRISGHERSIVTDIAGTTRDTVEETVVFGGCKLILTDTAGIRETGDTVEKIGVARAESEMEKAELIFCVFSEEWTDEDARLARKAAQCGGKKVFLFNKCDLTESRLFPDWADLADASFFVSAKSGEGLDSVAEFVKNTVFASAGASGALITNARQYQCLCRIDAILERAIGNLALTPDVILQDAEQALAVLGEITGESVSDRVVGEIFSRFCVGK